MNGSRLEKVTPWSNPVMIGPFEIYIDGSVYHVRHDDVFVTELCPINGNIEFNYKVGLDSWPPGLGNVLAYCRAHDRLTR